MTRRPHSEGELYEEMYRDMAWAYDRAIDALVQISKPECGARARVAEDCLMRMRAHWAGVAVSPGAGAACRRARSPRRR